MKKNKFFAGVVVLLFVFSFSVSQVLLAQNSPQNPVECPEGGGIGVVNYCFNTITTAPGHQVRFCGTCQWVMNARATALAQRRTC